MLRPPSKEKEHTIDINCARLFIETPELHAQLVAIVQRHCHLLVRWEGRQNVCVHVVLRLMLQSLWHMHKVWRFVGRVPLATCIDYEAHVTRFGKAWEALGCSVPVWVHWCVCHSAPLLMKWHNLAKFSSIPTEWRNQGFKMDIRHCFQGFKLSKPYVTRWGLKHSLVFDALDWGIRTWYARKGVPREAMLHSFVRPRRFVKRRKHM